MAIKRRRLLGYLAGAASLSFGAAYAKDRLHGNEPNTPHREPGNRLGRSDHLPPVSHADRVWRPNIHFTPLRGFANDPNGLIYDGKLFHFYYQFDPYAAIAGHVNWGHAVSEDLYHWRDRPIAISETDKGEAFSGSVVNDKNNSSGFFAGAVGTRDNEANLAAIYTRATPTSQTQYVAFSRDNGDRYEDYADNPVLATGGNSFRDPKVFWHEPTKKWVLVAVKASARKVAFYGSFDLKSWMHLSDFGPTGLFGVEWECPNLVELPVKSPPQAKAETRWVLFVSINPGAPLGGSGTQYFIGSFDGERFTAENQSVGLIDFCKDNYALQFYNDFPKNKAVAISWIGNWQYCETLPTQSWRGAMTLPREMWLERDSEGWFDLYQMPVGLEALRKKHLEFTFPTPNVPRLKPMQSVHSEIPRFSALEFNMDVKIEAKEAESANLVLGKSGRLIIKISNVSGEECSIGFDAFSSQMWLDRDGLRGFKNPFFNDSFSVALPKDSREFTLKLVIDGCTLEMYVNGGQKVGTALIFPESPLTQFSIMATNAAAQFRSLEAYVLERTMQRPFP